MPLVFFYLGSVWAGVDQENRIKRDKNVGAISDLYVEAQGKITSLEKDEGVMELELKKNRMFVYQNGKWVEDVSLKVPGILVSFKENGSTAAEPLGIGQIVAVRGQVKPFSNARNPGEFDFKAYYQSLGLEFRLQGEEIRLLNPRKHLLLEQLRVMKSRCKALLYRDAKEEDAGIFAAAVLGDKTGISDEIKSLYQKNGIAHLLAVSGLHLSFFGLSLYTLLRKAGAGYFRAGIISSILILLYGILTGSSPSVIRAGIMMCAGFMAACLGRTYDLMSAASLSLLILSIHSPLLLLQGGVQLSFGAVYAIGGLMPPVRDWLGKDQPFAGSISACVAIQMVTMPITVFHFYQIPPYGLILNLLVIPLMGGVLLSGVGVIVFGSVHEAFGTAAAGTGHYILKLYEFLLKAAKYLPGHNVILGKPDQFALAVYVCILAAGTWFLVRHCKREKKEEECEEETTAGIGIPYAGKLLLLFGICWLSILLFLPRPVKGLEAWFLDVGQGDGILLRTQQYAVLLDGGSSSKKSMGEYTLTPCLKSLGVPVIDYAIISHGDLDHLSGVKYLLESCEEIQIKNLILPYHGKEDESIQNLAQLGSKRGTKVWYLMEGDRLMLGRLSVLCLYPGREDRPEDVNGESVVLKVDYGACHLLFTGDMGEREEENLLLKTQSRELLGEINVLKTAHHGSKYSSSESFLDAITPEWAVISYGKGNSYGHPHKEVLERFKERDITVFETGINGAIKLFTDGKRIGFFPYIDGE